MATLFRSSCGSACEVDGCDYERERANFRLPCCRQVQAFVHIAPLLLKYLPPLAHALALWENARHAGRDVLGTENRSALIGK